VTKELGFTYELTASTYDVALFLENLTGFHSSSSAIIYVF
jgi:hypothetical protein